MGMRLKIEQQSEVCVVQPPKIFPGSAVDHTPTSVTSGDIAAIVGTGLAALTFFCRRHQARRLHQLVEIELGAPPRVTSSPSTSVSGAGTGDSSSSFDSTRAVRWDTSPESSVASSPGEEDPMVRYVLLPRRGRRPAVIT